MKFLVEIEQEEDGRWIAEIPELPGGMAYRKNSVEAAGKAQALALRVIAERIEHSIPTAGAGIPDLFPNEK
jgi:predicted RNase H-like HicB family nuclease